MRFWFLVFRVSILSLFFFFNDTATTEIYTLSLHDALPISSIAANLPHATSFSAGNCRESRSGWPSSIPSKGPRWTHRRGGCKRSEEHTSELQSQSKIVCRLLL